MDSQENQLNEIEPTSYFLSDDKLMENIRSEEKWNLYSDS